MPEFTFEWLVKDRVALLSDFPEEMNAANLDIAMEIMKRMYEESTSDHIHYISDISNVRNLPVSMSSLTGAMPLLRNKRLASLSMVSQLRNPLVKVILKTLSGALPLYFSRDTDAALQNLYAMHPDLVKLTHPE